MDAYDRHQKELEEKLDEKTTLLIHLQVRGESTGTCCKVIVIVNRTFPVFEGLKFTMDDVTFLLVPSCVRESIVIMFRFVTPVCSA